MASEYKIICVDDDKDVLDIIVETVEQIGYPAVGFNHPSEAIPYIEENRSQIILILSDLRMDDINGFQFKKNLPKSTQEIPFVIITGYWTQEMSAEAMELGVQAFLEKPVKKEVLSEQIENFGKLREEVLNEEREMVEGFLEETSPMLDEIESLILELEESSDKEQPLAVYFRLLHTIKGTASCVGLVNLGDYTHKYEDFIGELRNRTIPVNTLSINVLLNGLDDLKQFFDEVEKQGNDQDLKFEDKLGKFTDLEAIKSETSEPTANQTVQEDKKINKAESESKSDEDKMTVSMGLLNKFMEESGELTVIRNSILKTVKKIETRYRGDDDIEQLNELLTGMYSVTSNIQGKITEMRKVPVKNTLRPFKRLVRDLSKKLGKDVELTIKGEELLIDNIIAKLFSNTLIHIVRNSLDHGIESKDDRVAKGKDPTGNLIIETYPQGEEIILKVTDDGKGINPSIIRKKAVEKGMHTEDEVLQMTDLQVVNLVFDSGFSTAEQVSDLSGRGVGMDMVRGSFRDMGGEVYVQSEVDKGSCFTLSVPIPKSVLIINTLSVEASGKTMLFQMDEVVEVLRYEKDNNTTKMYKIDTRFTAEHNGEMIDLIHMNDVFRQEYHHENEEINIVILRVGAQKFGVIVDKIYEFEEVVMRKISTQIVSHNLYHGASLVGAGEVALILSAEGIANSVGIEIIPQERTLDHVEQNVFSDNISEYMLFKYSETDQLGINLTSVERFEKIQSSQIEQIGDRFIVRYLDRNLILVDPGYHLGLKSESILSNEVLSSNQTFDVIVSSHEGSLIGLIVHTLGEIKVSSDDLNVDTIDLDGLEGSLYLEGKTVSILDVEFLRDKIFEKKQLLKTPEHKFELKKAA